jgi:hypothetical protein
MRQDGTDAANADVLSEPARQLLAINASSAYEKLVVSSAGNAAAQSLLKSLTPQSVLPEPAVRAEFASAMLAGLWLWHDFLDESHTISQGIGSDTGSFWHAIMHRREGDFSNSKYWYRRCQNHPTYTILAANAQAIINPHPADKAVFRLTASGWNPDALVDLAEETHASPSDPRHRLTVALQQLEWRTLFDFCTRQAMGGV